jgi:hypothetical protein
MTSADSLRHRDPCIHPSIHHLEAASGDTPQFPAPAATGARQRIGGETAPYRWRPEATEGNPINLPGRDSGGGGAFATKALETKHQWRLRSRAARPRPPNGTRRRPGPSRSPTPTHPPPQHQRWATRARGGGGPRYLSTACYGPLRVRPPICTSPNSGCKPFSQVWDFSVPTSQLGTQLLLLLPCVLIPG